MWIDYEKETPPSDTAKIPQENPSPTWYNVKLSDGTETKLCWWLGSWYCSVYNAGFVVVKEWFKEEDA